MKYMHQDSRLRMQVFNIKVVVFGFEPINYSNDHGEGHEKKLRSR